MAMYDSAGTLIDGTDDFPITYTCQWDGTYEKNKELGKCKCKSAFIVPNLKINQL